jgi:hypothetical protein
VLTEVYSLATRYRLTAYDASYLELALRRNLPLATLDIELNRVHFGTVGSPLGWEFCCSHMMICIGTRLFQISVTS